MGASGLPHGNPRRIYALSRLGIVAALALEARAFGHAEPHGSNLMTGAEGELLAICGIGAQAAARGAEDLVQAGATGLASFGLAGALDPGLRAGRLLLPAKILSDQGARLGTSEDWRERLRTAADPLDPCDGVALLTCSRLLETVAQKTAAWRSTGAAAVDMESHAVGRVAARHSIPFVAVRVIIDTASDALPRSMGAASRAGRLEPALLLRELARHPEDIADLVRLAARYRVARRTLLAAAAALRASAP